jgi:hypothetical protein
MPDSTSNFVVDAVNGPIPSDSVTRAEFITALEQLNYANGNIRSIDNLSGAAGLVSIDGSGAANVRSITGATGLTVANGDGSGNPEVSLNAPHTFRQTYNDTSSNTVSDTKLYNIISTGTAYTLTQPVSGYVTVKNIVNASAAVVVISSSDWGPAGISNVSISPGETLTVISNVAQKWYPQNALSEVNPFGAIYRTSASATSVGAGYTNLSVTTSTASNMIDFEQASNGQLKYTGLTPINAEVTISISGKVSTNSDTELTFTIAKKDASANTTTYIPQPEQTIRLVGNSDVRNISIVSHVELHQNDYVFVGIRETNTTTSNSFTPSKFYMAASGHKIITA